MRAAVTGATGFLGRQLCRELIRRGFQVRALIRNPDKTDAIPEAAEQHAGDLAEPDSLKGLADNCELFFHLGAATSGEWPVHQAATVEGTRACLAMAEKAGVRRFIHVSSIVVFRIDGAADGDLLNDDSSKATDSPSVGAYARGKVEAEAVVQQFMGDARLEATIIRPGLIYGPDRILFPHLGLRVGRTFLAIGGESLILPLCSAGSVVESMLLSATSRAAASRSYTVVDENETSRRAYLDLLNDLTGSRYSMISLPVWPLAAACGGIELLRKLPGLGVLPDTSASKVRGRALSLRFETKRLQDETGWKAPVSLRDELASVLGLMKADRARVIE